jgi:lipoprotein-anchoring transpeptidase ErfK/SrfK
LRFADVLAAETRTEHSRRDEQFKSTSMQRIVAIALVASALGTSAAHAQLVPFYPDTPTQRGARLAPQYQPPRGHLGGGFIEALFGGSGQPTSAHPGAISPAQPQYYVGEPYGRPSYVRADPAEREAVRYEMSPAYRRQVVDYSGDEKPGTIIIDTPRRFLYLVQEDGKALRYGIGVGRPGFTWAGVKHISAKREWPDWRPPDEMLRRRPDLPRYMAGGPENPLGARAMYLGTTLYRIHGSNEPWTIGTQVSSGCIRMRNEDVIDLYERVRIGTKVVVI